MFKWIGSIKGFVKEVKAELIKCTWPTKKETLQGTLMVAKYAMGSNVLRPACAIQLLRA